jgi:hypothetical protein
MHHKLKHADKHARNVTADHRLPAFRMETMVKQVLHRSLIPTFYVCAVHAEYTKLDCPDCGGVHV